MFYPRETRVREGERRQTLRSLIRTCRYLSVEYFPSLAEVDIHELRDYRDQINMERREVELSRSERNVYRLFDEEPKTLRILINKVITIPVPSAERIRAQGFEREEELRLESLEAIKESLGSSLRRWTEGLERTEAFFNQMFDRIARYLDEDDPSMNPSENLRREDLEELQSDYRTLRSLYDGTVLGEIRRDNLSSCIFMADNLANILTRVSTGQTYNSFESEEALYEALDKAQDREMFDVEESPSSSPRMK